MKNYELTAAQLKPLAEGHGNCIASHRILVAGAFVGYMYRADAGNEHDNCWRFLASDESDEYANDRKIIPLLTSPIGAQFERFERDSEFIEVP